VIYVFDTAVACGDLGAAGWDTKIHDQTGAVELKLLGTAAGTYPVSTTPNGAAGQALVNFTVGDIEMEQELSRPYVYVSRLSALPHEIGFTVISLKDPQHATVIYDWRSHSGAAESRPHE
jgi:hypothetical protein